MASGCKRGEGGFFPEPAVSSWHTLSGMRVRLAVVSVLTLSAAACSKACAPSSAGAGRPVGYSYLVTPSGRMFRLLKTGPATNAEHQKVGMLVLYAGESAEIPRIQADAEALVAALGPEMEAAGETELLIRVVVGFDPRKEFSPTSSYDVAFKLTSAGQWSRIPTRPGEARAFDGVGATAPVEDATFPFDRKATEAAARAAGNWLALLDARAPEAALAEMTEAFRAQVAQAPAQWDEVTSRRDGLSGSRVELYRRQSRPTNIAAPASGITAVEYLAKGPTGARLLERVTLLCESTGCKAAGYTFAPVPGG